MILKKIGLEQYRAADNISLDLDSRLNVFVGVNGAGKTTILDASALLLSWLVSRLRHGGSSGRPIAEIDIRNGQSTANISLVTEFQLNEISWNIAKTRPGNESRGITSNAGSIKSITGVYRELITETKGNTNIPVFAYYPVNRVVLDIPLKIKKRHSFDLLDAYDESLTGAANFRTFFEWFREREDLENEMIRDNRGSDQMVSDSQLDAVRAALEVFIPEFSDLTVRRNPLRMEVVKNGKSLWVNQLSDGERCLMAMVGDLARRMAIANPEGADPLKGEGVVLIDEIDLHLHPSWQRVVVPRLLEVFPNCQFLVSTHSPHVITHVQKENIFLLSMDEEQRIRVEKPTEAFGKTTDRVLKDLMGLSTTRPDMISDRIDNLYRLIDAGDLEKAQLVLKSLKKMIGEDPELIKAGSLIKRKEILGK